MRLQTPLGQTVLMGLIFFFVFSAYITIQGFAAKLYGAELASNMEMTLYATFGVACFASPTVTNVLGAQATLTLGVLGYGALVAASLLLSIVRTWWTEAIVIGGGAVLGVGAACLWTAQGRLLLEWADGHDQAALFSVFWALFNMSALAGGCLTFFYFSTSASTGSWPLYAVFLSLILVGALAARLGLSPPPKRAARSAAEPLVAPAAAPGPLAQARATLTFFRTRRMRCLAPLFLYTGFNQPYQLNGFGDRAFTNRALGVELALFYGAEILGGFLCGCMLDAAPPPRRR